MGVYFFVIRAADRGERNIVTTQVYFHTENKIVYRELVCAVSDGLPAELMDFLREHPADELHILLKTAESEDLLNQCAPFTADYPIPKQGTMYYLCKDGACKAPLSDLTKLNL